MATLVVGSTVNGGGVSLTNSTTLTAPARAVADPVLPTAKAGSLTDRTDADTGELTLAAGHGVTAGQRLDVFWIDPATGEQKCRHKCAVGTVAGDVVPVDLGAGDDLPPQDTAVTAQVPTPMEFGFDQANLLVLAVSGGAAGKVVVEKADGTVVFHRTLGANGAGFTWAAGFGTNPLSDTPATAFLSNGSAAQANTVTAFAGLSS